MRDDDRAPVRRRDPTHELVRAPGQRERRPVVPLRLPVRVQAHDSDDRVRLLRELHRARHELVRGRDLCAAQADAGVRVHERLDRVFVGGRADVHEVDEDLVLDPGLEPEDAVLLCGAGVEEGVAAPLLRPVIDEELAVDVELGAARGEEAELEVGVFVPGLEEPAKAERETLGKFLREVDAIEASQPVLGSFAVSKTDLRKIRVSSMWRVVVGFSSGTRLSSLSCEWK